MHVIKVRNVNQALYEGLRYLAANGLRSNSRNGLVIRAPEAVTTTYENPKERILWLSTRDANPIFHALESFWMLAGRNDVKFPSNYAAQLAEYSDDGVILNAAYGYRWRKHYGYDQLKVIVDELKVNPDSRRCVLQIWDGGRGTYEQSELYQATHGCKDTACNTAVYFEVLNGKLNMTVTNRSNDVIWGAYGANAVHFSILQEYMAHCIDVEVGVYEQVSNNYHIYTGRPDVDRLYDGKTLNVPKPSETDAYWHGCDPTPLFNGDQGHIDRDIAQVFSWWDSGNFNDPLWSQELLDSLDGDHGRCTAVGSIMIPMIVAHRCFKEKEYMRAEHVVMKYMDAAPDWQQATLQWFERRADARAKKEAVTA